MLVKLKPLFTIVFIFIIGCAPKLQLVKGVTPEQLNKDNAECRLEAQKATQFDLTGNAFIHANNVNSAISNCLQAKGYTYQVEPNEQGKAIAEKYKQSFINFKEKTKNDTDYIVNNCRPKEDKEYITCLNEINEKQATLYVFPDLYRKFLNERKEYENLLIRKDITRLQFKEATEKLGKELDAKSSERIDNDVKTGIYTGRY